MTALTPTDIESEIDAIIEWMREDGDNLIDDRGVDQTETTRLSLWQALRGYGCQPIENLWLHVLPDFDETLWIED